VVVAEGDRVLRIAGLGQRKAGAPEPVTEDTVFAAGSVTKMFTAVALALAVGEGKLAFEDRPRRFVPEFRLRDPEADAKLNLIDLLAHRSGLDRSDGTWLYVPFTQAELFQLAGRAMPAAKLREKFIYNNTMVTLAGEVVARAYGTSYERLLGERVLAPLGMQASTLTRAALLASSNHAEGYAGAASAVKPVKAADLSAVVAAGGLNSTARDLGAWLRFLNERGQSANLRIAPAAFARLFERHSADGGYGLGFYLETRRGLLVAHHPGNVPGYTAEIALVPEKALAMALLTNQDNSALAAVAMELFWALVVSPELPHARTAPAAPPPAASGLPIAAERLVGHYFSNDDLAVEVKQADGALALLIPGAPPLPMKPLGVNLYELVGSGGFAMSAFQSEAMPGRIAAALKKPPSQPGGDIPLLKRDAAWLARARAQHGAPHAALIGAYRSPDRRLTMEIVPWKGGVALNIVGEPPRLLLEAGRDLFLLEGRPATHRLELRRSGSNAVVGFTLGEPGAKQEMAADGAAPTKDAARGREILERAAAAAGGTEALDRLGSLTAIGRAAAPAQGIEGRAEDRIVPGKRAQLIELGAFGKALSTRSWTGEKGGTSIWIDGARAELTGKALAAQRFFAVPHTLYRWKQRFAEVAATGETVVNGENAFVVEVTPPGLAASKLYVSTSSSLILREEHPAYIGDQVLNAANGVDYSDYRAVRGVKTPFAATVVFPILGRIELAYERVTFDTPIDPRVFEEP
jgi:CubicO group peptidase (beta-lactamase class C family)